MITPRFFDQQLPEVVREDGKGVPVVTVYLTGGLSYRVKSVRQADHEYVLLDVYRKRGTGDRTETVAIAYETISHVAIAREQPEEAERLAFVVGD